LNVGVEPTLAALALTGLLGGLGHCTGMCGPLVALAAVRLRERRAQRPAAARPSSRAVETAGAEPGVGSLGVVAAEPGVGNLGVAAAEPGVGAVRVAAAMLSSTLAYHGARVAVYAALGAVVGAAGSLLGAANGVTTLGAAVSLILGVGVLALGLGYAGLLPGVARTHGAHLWAKTASWALRRPGLSGAGLLGALNGLLPCGLVYSALLVSAGTGNAAGGALSMLVFGIATLPALVVIHTGAGALGPTRRVWLLRAAGVVVALIGIQLCLRSLATLGVVPSVHLGRLMLW
jgi:sulfite exporter TauE/SafE